MAAGYMEAEEGVEIPHYLPSCQGFWLHATKRPAAVLAVLLSAHTVRGPAPLPLFPEGPGTKVAVVIAGGGAWRAGTLLSAHTLPSSLRRWGCAEAQHCAPAVGDPPGGRKANPEPDVYGEQASACIHIPYIANLYGHQHTCKTQETA